MASETPRERGPTTELVRAGNPIGTVAGLEGRRLLGSKSILALFAFLTFSAWRITTNNEVVFGDSGASSSYYMVLSKPDSLDAVYAIFGFVDTTWHLHSFLFLVPIVGLLVGYATIVNIRAAGQLRTLLSLPCSRSEVLLGAWLGRSAVFAVGTVAALAVGWIGIVTHFESASIWNYLLFSATTVAYGVACLSIGVALSVSFATPRRVAVVVVFLILNTFLNLESFVLDKIGLFPAGLILDPRQAYLILVAAPNEEMVPKVHQIAVGQVDRFTDGHLTTGELAVDPPTVLTWPVAGIALALWIVCPVLYARFRIRSMEVQ